MAWFLVIIPTKVQNNNAKSVKMNIDAANKWPITVAALAGDKTIQNEPTLPIFSRNHQRPVVLSSGAELYSDKFREKGSMIDIYI